jgi:hypothetical protein
LREPLKITASESAKRASEDHSTQPGKLRDPIQCTTAAAVQSSV